MLYMNKIQSVAAGAAFCLLALFAGCHELPDYDNTPQGNFEALWTLVDEHYCFFADKNVDWDEIGDNYRAQVSTHMSSKSLFSVMSAMLDELRDGHVNLSAPFATSYYRKWWSDYPQNFDERIIQQNYFAFGYTSLGSADYGVLLSNVGYLRWPTFDSRLGAGNIDYILASFSMTSGLIIDIRDNGGGMVSNANDLASHFVTEPFTGGYIYHKNGPGHDDFSSPYAVTINPVGDGHIVWTKPVVILTNRGTFSAANYFTAVMKQLPNVTVVGAVTGGGCGMPVSYELPNGWGIRLSASPLVDAAGRSTEAGVEPTPGCEVGMDPEAAFNGRDTMLDFAIDYIVSSASR